MGARVPINKYRWGRTPTEVKVPSVVHNYRWEGRGRREKRGGRREGENLVEASIPFTQTT